MRSAFLALLALAGSAAADKCESWPPCTLQVGFPAVVDGSHEISGHGFEKHYFNVTLNSALNGDVTFALNVFAGDADIYVTKPNQDGSVDQPTTTHYWRAALSTRSRDILPVSSADIVNGTYGIMINVFGTRSSFSTYSFVVQDSHTDTVIFSGFPVRDEVVPGDIAHYVYTVAPDDKANALTISVSPLSGDPDLIVSKNKRPTRTDADYRSSFWGGDAITIPETEHADAEHYYIGVYCFTTCTFTVSAAMKSSNITLLEGVPFQSALLPNADDRFTVRTDGTAEDVTLTVTPITGSVTVYVTTNDVVPSPETAIWKTNWQSFNPFTITMLHTDPGFLRTSGKYNVLVRGGYAGANYTITASHTNSAVELRDSTPTRETVNAGRYEYFYFPMSDLSKDFFIDVTVLSGDPDVYVACNFNGTGNDDGFPSRARGHYVARSLSFGRDLLRIPANSPGHCANSTQEFYIAVYGFRASTYSITVTGDTDQEVLVEDGLPQHGLVQQGHYRRYRYYIPDVPHINVTLSLSTLYGDANAYANTDGRKPYWSANPNFATNTVNGRNAIVIAPGMPHYCSGCWIRIGVHANHTSTYVLSVSTDQAIVALADGVPVQEHLETGEIEHFKYYNEELTGTLRITVTPLGGGDADLYVSQTVTRPTLANHTWISSAWGEDMVEIQNAKQGPYFIGVYGWYNTTFTLQAHLESSNTYNYLLPGIPQSSSVGKNKLNVFLLAVGNSPADQLVFTVTPRSGDVGIYINACDYGSLADGQDCSDKIPHTSDLKADFESTDALTQDTVVIDATAPKACRQRPQDDSADCYYIISVFGVTDADFSIVAAPSDDAITLQERVPHRASVQAGGARYYHFSLLQEHLDVIVLLTTLDGSVTSYVDFCHGEGTEVCNTHPSAGHSKFQSAAWGSDHITIAASDPKACVPSNGVACEYYIGVVAAVNSSYIISVGTHDDHPMALIDGEPQEGSVADHTWAYYEIRVPSYRDGVDVTLTPSFGDADLYVSIYNSTGASLRRNPTLSVYDYRSMRWGSDSISINTASDTYTRICGNDRVCFIRIGVHGYQATRFTVTATTAASEVALQDGRSHTTVVWAGGSRFFRFPLQSLSQSLQVAVTPYQGRVALFMDYAQPHCSAAAKASCTAVWQNWAADEEIILVDHTNPCASVYHPSGCHSWTVWRSGQLHISVLGIESSTFSLQVSTVGDVITVQDNRPIVSQTALRDGSHVAYFEYVADTSKASPDIRVEVKRQCRSDGCKTDSVRGYVVTCKQEACTAADARPSATHHSSTFLVGEATEMIVSGQSLPADAYVRVYVAVTSVQSSVPFLLTVGVTSGVEVLPNFEVSNKLAVRALPVAFPSRIYEAYAGPRSEQNTLFVSLEACYGAPEAYICDSRCPEPNRPTAVQRRHSLRSGDGAGPRTLLQRFASDAFFFNVSAPVAPTNGDAPALLRVATGENWTSLHSSDSLTLAPGDEGAIEVSWGSAESRLPSGNPATPLPVTYKVFLWATGAQSKLHRTDTACGLELMASELGGAATTVTTTSTTAVLSGLEVETTYTVNVVATAAEPGTGNPLTLAYSSSTITTPKAPVQWGWIAFGIVLGVILLCSIPIVYLYRHNKLLYQQLDYEREDIRNVAAVATPSADDANRARASRAAERTAGLLADDDVAQHNTADVEEGEEESDFRSL